MFRLKLPQSLAVQGFNASVLSAMEHDALNLALLQIQNTKPGQKITLPDLIREGNALLPRPNDGQDKRLLFATRHQEQDANIDSLLDFGHFITSRVPHVEEKLSMQAQSKAPEKAWGLVLEDLAVAYSYVLESMVTFMEQGLVPTRRLAECQAIVTRPQMTGDSAAVRFFDSALAFYEERHAESSDDTSLDNLDRPGA